MTIRIGKIPTLRQMAIRNRRLFLRLDFNVPLVEKDGVLVVADDTRIREALPTIQFCLDQNAKIVIGSHLGRPDGKVKPEFSLEPVALHLADLLKVEVLLAEDCIGESVSLMVQNLKEKQVLLLENLRFHPGEEKNDPEFARQLARLADLYISDAFGTVHRKHASTYGLPSIMPDKCMGLLVEREIKFLDRLIQDPVKPFYTILGGSKVSDKIKTLQTLLQQVDGLLVGGAMAYAFMAAQNRELPQGAKAPKKEDVDVAGKCLQEAKRRQVPIFLPQDTVDAFDIGPVTVEGFCKMLGKARTVFWNGPLGWFEKPPYNAGTNAIAEFLSTHECLKVVGGGDTVSAIHASGFAAKFDHLSTGGGAVLEYLEGNGLPGIDILKAESRIQP